MKQQDRTGILSGVLLFGTSFAALALLALHPHPEEILQLSRSADAYLPDSFRLFVNYKPVSRIGVIARASGFALIHLLLVLWKRRLEKRSFRSVFRELAPFPAVFLPLALLPLFPSLSPLVGRILLVIAAGLYGVLLADSFRLHVRALLEFLLARKEKILLSLLLSFLLYQILLPLVLTTDYPGYVLGNGLDSSLKKSLRRGGVLLFLLPLLLYLAKEGALFRKGSLPERMGGWIDSLLETTGRILAKSASPLMAGSEALKKGIRSLLFGEGSLLLTVRLTLLALSAGTALYLYQDPLFPYRYDLLAPALFALPLLLLASLGGKLLPAPGTGEGEGKKTALLALAGVVLMALLSLYYFSHLARERLHAFLPAMYDLSFQHQALWNMAYNGAPWLSLGESGGLHDRIFWPDHVPLFYYLFVPIYRLAPAPETLLLLQNFFLAAAALPLFFLGKKMTGSPLWGALFSLLFLLHPSIQSMHIWDVQATSFAPLLFLLALYWYESDRKGLFLLFLILGGLTREDMNLFTVSIALLLLFVHRDSRWGLIALITGLVQFIIMSVVLQGYFGGISHYERFLPLFYMEGEYSITGIVSLALFNPLYFLKTALVYEKGVFLLQLLLPLALLPLLAGEAWILALAGLASTVLSMKTANFTLGYQYSTLLVLAFFYMSLLVLRQRRGEIRNGTSEAEMRSKTPSSGRRVWNTLALYLFLAAFVYGHLYGYLFPRTYRLGFIGDWSDPFADRLYPERYLYRDLTVVTRRPPVITEEMKTLRQVVDSLPPHLKTAAPVSLSVPLTGRRYSYVLPRVEDADVVVVHPLFDHYQTGLDLVRSGEFVVKEKRGETLLLTRTGKAQKEAESDPSLR